MGNSILARNILLLEALEEIAASAAKKKLKFILLKGAALLAEGACAPGEREMTDLDMLIRPTDEKSFDGLLTALGFKPMENSSQAYYRMTAISAPPVIADLHTALWHQKATQALWHRSRPLPHAGALTAGVPGFEDQLLHLASHGLLYHGYLSPKGLEDLARLLRLVYGKTDRDAFWLKAADISSDNGLNPVVHPVLRRFHAAEPGLLSAAELSAFEPRGMEKLKSLFFEKAAAEYSRPLEYLLPGFYRPSLFFKYMFPGRTFLEKRYGKASRLNMLARPIRLLAAIAGMTKKRE